MLTLTLLTSCFVVRDCPHCEAFDCEEIALRDPAGGPDACDLAACEACVDGCGMRCAVQESYPPRYTCPHEAWDAYDTCPDWAPPGPHAEDVVDLGCGTTGGETLTATSTTPGRIDVDHADYAGGCCPQEVDVSVVTSGSSLEVSYTLVDDFCECYCELDVSYAIVEVPSGTWTLVAGASQATTSVHVE